MPSRLPIIGVMGSAAEAHTERAAPLGRWLATLPLHLLTGGGGGVMDAVSRAFAESSPRRGLVIGVVPAASADSPVAREGYPNPWVEIAIFTHLPLTGDRGIEPLSRNHINVLTSDLVVALPGGKGTSSEVTLALRYHRPVVAYLASRADLPDLPASVPLATTLDEVKEFVTRTLNL